MIKYNLICANDHEFEAWFSKSLDFDHQSQAQQISCPHCANLSVRKAVMSPNITTSKRKHKSAQEAHKRRESEAQTAAHMRNVIENKCDYVGDQFAQEARAIHYGETSERAIYGQASPREVFELTEEGVEIAPLPAPWVPKPKKSLN